MAKRSKDPELTRENIRETASALFRTGGVHATSLADISKAVKLSKGTLYYHYPSKEYLVMDIAEGHFGQMTEIIFAWIDNIQADATAEDALRPLADALLSDPDAMKLHFALLSEALREENALRKRVCAKQREWSVMLEVGALKISGAGGQRFRTFSRAYLALLDGFALHMLLNANLNADMLHTLITGG